MSVPTGPRRDGLMDAAAAARQTADELNGLVIDLVTRRPPSPRPADPAAPRAGRIRLTPWQRMEVEQTRKLLMDASDLFATRPAAYVAGLVEGAASNLLDIIDAVTEL